MSETLDNASLFHIHQSIIQEHMEFLYKGQISDEVINVLLEIVKKKFNDLNIEYVLRKKIYNIAVECLENIRDHGVQGITVDSIFIIGSSGGEFYLGTGNAIEKDQTSEVDGYFKKINSKDKEELKKLYREVISDEVSNDSNDVGLGLIDIAMKANNRIEHKISTLNDDYDFLSVQVKIKL